MNVSLDSLSTFAPVLADSQADDVDGGILPIPWICWFFPEYCWPYYF